MLYWTFQNAKENALAFNAMVTSTSVAKLSPEEASRIEKLSFISSVVPQLWPMIAMVFGVIFGTIFTQYGFVTILIFLVGIGGAAKQIIGSLHKATEVGVET